MAKTNALSNFRLGIRTHLGFLMVTIVAMTTSYILMGPQSSILKNIIGAAFIYAFGLAVVLLITRVTTKQVEEVINNLGETSNDLMTASASLTESSHRLAEGASEQSASVQETSATMEETASLVQQTTQNTRQAVTLAVRAKSEATTGVDSIQKLLSSMDELEKSSEEVQKIIKVIDDMAFQTNILSLNAAVEAARAGDAGKGFAVVAEEVRNLAQRSAQAAKETTSLIDGNVGLTKNAVRVSEEVGDELKGIDSAVSKVKELLDEIATASQEQVIAVSQIAQALTQIDHVVQSQSSEAQKSASGADALEDYCNNLKKIMIDLVSVVKDPHKENFSGTPKIETHSAPRLTMGPSERRSASHTNLSGAVAVNPEDVIPLNDF